MDDTEKHDTIAKVIDRLAERYPDAPRPLVARVVAEEYETLDSSRIRTYIPTLVEHGAKNRLNREFTAQTPKI
jgi:chromosome segregation and condensation protein ScpB